LEPHPAHPEDESRDTQQKQTVDKGSDNLRSMDCAVAVVKVDLGNVGSTTCRVFGVHLNGSGLQMKMGLPFDSV
jgi:hypothetical protein